MTVFPLHSATQLPWLGTKPRAHFPVGTHLPLTMISRWPSCGGHTCARTSSCPLATHFPSTRTKPSLHPTTRHSPSLTRVTAPGSATTVEHSSPSATHIPDASMTVFPLHSATQLPWRVTKPRAHACVATHFPSAAKTATRPCCGGHDRTEAGFVAGDESRAGEST